MEYYMPQKSHIIRSSKLHVCTGWTVLRLRRYCQGRLTVLILRQSFSRTKINQPSSMST